MTVTNEPVRELSSLSVQRGRDLETLYKPGSQRKWFGPNGGFLTYQQNDTPNSREIANGENASLNGGEFTQSGLTLVEVAA